MADVASEWPSAAGYLDTAAYGLPSLTTVHAMQQWVLDWQSGKTPYSSWLPATDAARAAFAHLLGVDAASVATGTGASQLIGLVAASLPDRARVAVAEGEFTSLLYPLLAQKARGVIVEEFPLSRLAEGIRRGVDLVAFSIVSSATGELAPHEQVLQAAQVAGAATLVDAAQACGWLIADWGRFDYVVCPAFKWLSCPRGAAFMYVSPERIDAVHPHSAGWYSSQQGVRFFGGPLLLAETARRLDPSPVWPSWAGAAPALEILASIGAAALGRRALALANRFRDEVGLPPASSPIAVVNSPNAAARLRQADIVATFRPTGVRLAFHHYNSESDADRAAEAIGPVPDAV